MNQTVELLDGGTVEYPASIQFEVFQTVSLSEGELDQFGRDKIQEYLEGQGRLRVPADWDWALMIAKGDEYSGSLAKRIGKYQIKAGGRKLEPYMASEIGNIAASYSLGEGDYHYQFSRILAWKRGEFGDSKSCFFGGEFDNARYILGNAGGFALKLYRPDGVGYARCWILPILIRGNWSYILFNGYHDTNRVKRQLRLVHFAQLVSRIFGSGYTYTEAQVEDETGSLYINSYNYVNGERDGDDPSLQYLVHPKLMLPKRAMLRLDSESLHTENWEEFKDTCGWTEEVRPNECIACNRIVEQNGLFIDERWLCAACVQDNTFTCHDCHTLHLNGWRMRIRPEYIYVCPECAELRPHCVVCSEYMDAGQLYITNLGMTCSRCMSVHLIRCSICNDYQLNYNTSNYLNGTVHICSRHTRTEQREFVNNLTHTERERQQADRSTQVEYIPRNPVISLGDTSGPTWTLDWDRIGVEQE